MKNDGANAAQSGKQGGGREQGDECRKWQDDIGKGGTPGTGKQQRTMEDIDGRLHPAVDGQGLRQVTSVVWLFCGMFDRHVELFSKRYAPAPKRQQVSGVLTRQKTVFRGVTSHKPASSLLSTHPSPCISTTIGLVL